MNEKKIPKKKFLGRINEKRGGNRPLSRRGEKPDFMKRGVRNVDAGIRSHHGTRK